MTYGWTRSSSCRRRSSRRSSSTRRGGWRRWRTRSRGWSAWCRGRPWKTGDRAADALDRLAEIPQVKGVRRIVQFESDLDFCLRPDFVRGVQLLERYGLSCDICISHEQLANTIELVRQCPNITFVLDHIGKPDIAAGLMEPWKSELSELARIPNVHCKLSGTVTEADHQAWTRDDLMPYIDHVVESFGFDRVMFGGDWPVVLNASPYVRLGRDAGAGACRIVGTRAAQGVPRQRHRLLPAGLRTR